MDLFDYQYEKDKLKEAPLAARMRPTNLDEFVGQEHIVGPGQRAAPRHRVRPPPLRRPLGAAGLRQDHAGLHHGPGHRLPLHARLRRQRRRGRPAPHHRGGQRAPQDSPGRRPSSSSMKSTASTRPSRTPSCPTSRTAPSPSSAPPPKIPPSRSSRRCSPALAGLRPETRSRRPKSRTIITARSRTRRGGWGLSTWSWTTRPWSTWWPCPTATPASPSTPWKWPP